MKKEKTTILACGGDKRGMRFVLEPVANAIGFTALTDVKVGEQLVDVFDEMSNISNEESGELMTYALLAIKKWGLSIEETRKLIRERRTLEWCFEKHIMEGGDMTGGAQTMPINTPDPKEMAKMMLQPLLAEIGFEQLKDRDCVVPLMKRLVVVADSMGEDFNTADWMDELVFGVAAIKKYGLTIDQAFELSSRHGALLYCFSRYIMGGDGNIPFGIGGALDQFQPHYDENGDITGVEIIPNASMTPGTNTVH